MEKPIKAITLIQPWATLIAIGAKQYETRGWDTDYRGPLVIHAGKKIDKEICRQQPFARVLIAAGYYKDNALNSMAGYPLLDLDMIPLGMALCIVTLEKTFETGEIAEKLSAQERAFGDYTPGRRAFQLVKPRIFPTPIPCPGALSLWDWRGPTL